MHFVKVKNILSNKNGMNIYRGCTHGCIYCDTRSKCYGFTHALEDVEVKENALVLLEQTLIRKRSRWMIGLGSMSDPYMPLEKELKMTRGFLELIDKYDFGASLITKSDLVLRDLDLIKKINNKTKCVINMTLTTYDDALCRIVEPYVCPTSRRAEALKIFNDNGIETVVWLCPILPYINDTLENLKGILKLCKYAGVKRILCFDFGLTLREGDREYYYEQLDKHFLGLKEKYMKVYGNSYGLSSPNSKELWSYFIAFCKQNNIEYNSDKIFAYLNEFKEQVTYEQSSLF